MLPTDVATIFLLSNFIMSDVYKSFSNILFLDNFLIVNLLGSIPQFSFFLVTKFIKHEAIPS